ncbi:MAG: hypothetical protein CMO78_06340 [Verrucomicrobiales bacterium]|nr:hypothetical protein [Verrucomicrobiales bacterium]
MGHREVTEAAVKPKRPWHVRLRRKVRLDYLKILRTKGAPAQVARGVGYGIFVELLFFATIGVSIVLMYPLNKWGRGHMTASWVGFFFMKAFAWVFILPSIVCGAFILGTEVSMDLVRNTVNVLGFENGLIKIIVTWFKGATQDPNNISALKDMGSFIYAWIVGGVVVGAVVGAVGGFACWAGLSKYQAHRRERREQILRGE